MVNLGDEMLTIVLRVGLWLLKEGTVRKIVQVTCDATTMPQRFHNNSTAIQQNDTFTPEALLLKTFFFIINTAGWLSRRPVWNHVESSTLTRIPFRNPTMIPQ
jgi:hypothetical protein